MKGIPPHTCNQRCADLRQLAATRPPLSLAEMGRRYGVTPERIRQILAEHGWQKPRSRPATFGTTRCRSCGQRYPTAEIREHRRSHVGSRWDMERAALMVAQYEAGWTLSEILTFHNLVGAATFYHALRYAGLQPSRGVGQYDRKRGVDRPRA